MKRKESVTSREQWMDTSIRSLSMMQTQNRRTGLTSITDFTKTFHWLPQKAPYIYHNLFSFQGEFSAFNQILEEPMRDYNCDSATFLDSLSWRNEILWMMTCDLCKRSKTICTLPAALCTFGNRIRRKSRETHVRGVKKISLLPMHDYTTFPKPWAVRTAWAHVLTHSFFLFRRLNLFFPILLNLHNLSKVSPN